MRRLSRRFGDRSSCHQSESKTLAREKERKSVGVENVAITKGQELGRKMIYPRRVAGRSNSRSVIYLYGPLWLRDGYR